MSLNNEKKLQKDFNDLINDRIRLEILESKIRYRILLLLFAYGELSLTDLSNRLNKSKPALYHHLQKMIDLGLVEVSREKQVR
ncbi:MAG: winged helix-turn-helix domain-containing protein, partial [Candidatus Hodarchaeota archaeon]